MFRQYRWDVKSLLMAGENDLRIAFGSPVRFVAAQQSIAMRRSAGHSGRAAFTQSPLPVWLGLGSAVASYRIWKDIRLEGYEGARLIEVHLGQQQPASK